MDRLMDFKLLQPLFNQISQLAALSDQEGQFPEEEFELMKNAGLLHLPLRKHPYKFERNQTQKLLELLTKAGSASLPVGRIYEGHLNALLLIDLFGTDQQRTQYFHEVFEKQSLFAVWNTQDQYGLKIIETNSGKYRLEGAKTFCSGANWIQRPLVTGELISKKKKGWQMCIIPPGIIRDVTADKSFWKPMGMRASASFRMDFSGIMIDENDLLGPPDAYYRQPYFSAGAIRFAAVQLGGAQAILSHTHEFLKENERDSDLFQKARVGEIAYLVETGNLWLRRAAEINDACNFSEEENDALLTYVNMTKTVVNELCLKSMQLAERSVGAKGLMRPNPLERIHRDLTTYLKQPAPDEALTSIGGYVLAKSDTSGMW